MENTTEVEEVSEDELSEEDFAFFAEEGESYEEDDFQEEPDEEFENLSTSDLEIPESDENFVIIGYIMGTHGLKGEVKVRIETDFPVERFERVSWRNGTKILFKVVLGTFSP